MQSSSFKCKQTYQTARSRKFYRKKSLFNLSNRYVPLNRLDHLAVKSLFAATEKSLRSEILRSETADSTSVAQYQIMIYYGTLTLTNALT